MKRVVSLAIVAFMLFVMIPIAALSNTNQNASAAVEQQPAAIDCSQTKISTHQVRIVCSAAGVTVLNTVVTLPDVPPVTILKSGPTATVRIPGPTVHVPGPTTTATATKFIPGPPGATITQAPQTVTVAPLRPVRTVTITENPSVSPSGQPTTTGGTIEPDDNDTVLTFPEISFTKPEAVGLGVGAVLLLMLLIVLGMWAGYYLGYKDSDKAEAAFLKSLLGK